MIPPKKRPSPPIASKHPTMLRVLYKYNSRRDPARRSAAKRPAWPVFSGLLVPTDLLEDRRECVRPRVEESAAREISQLAQVSRATFPEQDGEDGNAADRLALRTVPP